MAYSPTGKYPGATEVDPNYQNGKFKDNNPSTTNNGSPLKAIDRNELLARDEAIMNDAGFEYNEQPDAPQDSQMFRAYKASLGNGSNLLSNHNFLIQTPDDSQPLPDATPRSYPPGYQIFSGVFANETTGITNLTYIDGRVSFSGGDLYFPVPNSGGLEQLTEFAASVADFDGKPRTRGVSYALVGDEYRVTVGIDALEDVSATLTPLGSVKFEQGGAATGHEVVELLTAQTVGSVTNYQADSVEDMIAGKPVGWVAGGAVVTPKLQQVWTVAGTSWKRTGLDLLLSSFTHITTPTLSSFGASELSLDNSQAISEADSYGEFVIDGNYKTDSVTINSNVTFSQRSSLEANESNSVTINGVVNAPSQAIFYGSVTLNKQLGRKEDVNPSWFGVSGSDQNTTSSTTAGNAAVTLASPIDFKNGQSISIEHGGAASTLSTPTDITVESTGLNRQGPAGTTTYSYRVSAIDESGAMSAASSPVTINDGNDTLGKITPSIRGLAFNVIRWTITPPAVAAAVWRSKEGGAYELLGVFGLGQSDSIASGVMDAGLPEFDLKFVPPIPNESPLNARLVTKVLSGGGTNILTLESAPSVSGSGLYTRHDDTLALFNYISASSSAYIPDGNYNVGTLNVASTTTSIQGNGRGSNIKGWGVQSAAVFCQSMPVGFAVKGIRVHPEAWHNQIGLQVNNTTSALVESNYLSGNLSFFGYQNNKARIKNNEIEDWIDDGIFLFQGDTNEASNNVINEGCEAIPQNAAAIQVLEENSTVVKGNRTLGKSVYSVKIEAGNQCIDKENWAFNTWVEYHHLAGSCSGCSIKSNEMYPGPLHMDYAISISNDDRPNVVMFANEIIDNYIFGCGVEAIAVVEFGGVNPDIGYTTIKGNTVISCNSNGLSSKSEIVIEGSNVHNTYIHNHTSFSRANIDYVVHEDSTTYGLPNNTQVGTIYGDSGNLGLVSLTGLGSSKLAGGGTGL